MLEGNVKHRRPHYAYDPIEYQYPSCKVVRHGKNHIVYAPDIVLGDVVHISADFTKMVPCDMIIFESSGNLTVTSYLEIMDQEHQEMFEFRTLGEELPPGACLKRGGFAPYESSRRIQRDCFKNLILNSPNFLPMGVRILQGEAKGLCVKIGNQTVQGQFMLKKK